MSRLLSRILLAMLMLPLAAVLYTVVFVLLVSQWGYPRSTGLIFTISGAVTWGMIGTYWFILWRGLVRWTRERITNTFLAAGAAAIAGLGAAGVVAMLLSGRENEFPAFVGSALAPLAWLIATA